MSDERVFSALLERVGANGCYQKIMMGVTIAVMTVSGAVNFANTFLFYQNDYNCPSTITNCKEHVCSLSPEAREAYVDPNFSSLASEFGDYRCQESSDMEHIQAISYFGGILALLATILLSRFLTMKNTIVLWLILTVIGLTIVVVFRAMWIVTVGLTLAMGATSVLMEAVNAYISVIAPDEMRALSILLAQVGFALATSALGAVYYFITKWWLATLLYLLIPSAVTFAITIWLAEDTPLEKITRSTPKQSKESFQRIARMNGVECDIEENQLEHLKDEYHENQRQKSQEELGFTDLFRYKSLRCPTICSLGMHFFVGYQFNASQLALHDYDMSIYVSGPIVGISEVVFIIIGLFIADLVPRKVGVIVPQVAGIVVCIILVIWFPCLKEGECSEAQKIVQVIGIFTYRFFCCATYFFFYLGQVEMFPAQIKTVAMMLTAIALRSAIVIIPYAQYFCEQANVSIILTYAVSSLLLILARQASRRLTTSHPLKSSKNCAMSIRPLTFNKKGHK